MSTKFDDLWDSLPEIPTQAADFDALSGAGGPIFKRTGERFDPEAIQQAVERGEVRGPNDIRRIMEARRRAVVRQVRAASSKPLALPLDRRASLLPPAAQQQVVQHQPQQQGQSHDS